MAPPRRQRRLNAVQQLFALRGLYPDATVRFDRDRIIWIGKLQPTSASVAYTVRIDHRMGRVPRVLVLDPPLKRQPGEELPHVYPGDQLCLYYGDEFDDSKDFIAHTIVPWASEWLLHYEFWLITGEWHGGGVHLPEPDDKALPPKDRPRYPRLAAGAAGHSGAAQTTSTAGMSASTFVLALTAQAERRRTLAGIPDAPIRCSAPAYRPVFRMNCLLSGGRERALAPPDVLFLSCLTH